MNFDIFNQEPDMDENSNETHDNLENNTPIITDDEIESDEDAKLPYIPLLKESPKIESKQFPLIKQNLNKKEGNKIDPTSIKSLMQSINEISNDTPNENQNTKNESLNIVINNLSKVIDNLSEVDIWIPHSKESLSPKLKKISEPIVNALKAYKREIEKFK